MLSLTSVYIKAILGDIVCWKRCAIFILVFMHIQLMERSTIEIQSVIMPCQLIQFFCSFTGRMFDYHVLDMIELGIDSYKSMFDFEVRQSLRV